MPRPDIDPHRFTIHHAEVRGRVELAYVREGVGGRPLLLLHGYPETKRIWWRNIEPLAAAGYEVIVPDLRGYGDSGLAADDFYDVAAYSLDVHALVHEVLGHETVATAGGDLGGVVLYDLGLRFPGFVTRQVLFNTVTPLLENVYTAAGLPPDDLRVRRAQSDYFRRQATEPEALLAELDTPERRRAWVAPMYGHRLWGTPDAFAGDEVAFHAEPFGEADKIRATWGAVLPLRPPSPAVALVHPDGSLATVRVDRAPIGLHLTRLGLETILLPDERSLGTVSYASVVVRPDSLVEVAARRPDVPATVARHRAARRWARSQGLALVPVGLGAAGSAIEAGMRISARHRAIESVLVLRGRQLTGGGRLRRPVAERTELIPVAGEVRRRQRERAEGTGVPAGP